MNDRDLGGQWSDEAIRIVLAMVAVGNAGRGSMLPL